ncbi:MAG: hypothetical protein AUH81_11770 [Candidatus Rokubacteria bacterium 13_1_40CM_4_69_5]|nr:MAG: hypothetical protein AUH81_11770 [Candidatus Rokubacteria bacterium 13_1_40CM_4_69_5]OLE39930.1 MAG: hypothetical protein AUG00_00160 [Candidatus Rokubacteria bacterium 13_1_20CM_2_70_7]
MKKLGTKAALLVVALVVPAIGVYAVTPETNKVMVKADPLTGYQEATPAGVSTTGSGSFTAEIDEDAQTITYELTYSGLSAPAVVAHIHFGNRFTSGGVSAFLCGGGSKPACPAGTTATAIVTGTIIRADVVGPAGQGIAAGEFDELVRAIRAGMTYANVHTTNFPAGEIRGQINDANQRQP